MFIERYRHTKAGIALGAMVVLGGCSTPPSQSQSNTYNIECDVITRIKLPQEGPEYTVTVGKKEPSVNIQQLGPALVIHANDPEKDDTILHPGEEKKIKLNKATVVFNPLKNRSILISTRC